MSRLPSGNQTMSASGYQPYKQMSKSEYIASKNLPSQQVSKRSEQDFPVRAIALPEKPNVLGRGKRYNFVASHSPFNESYDMSRQLGRSDKKLQNSQEDIIRRAKIRADQTPSPTLPVSRSYANRQGDHVRHIEQYEQRISNLNAESQGLQNQLFTEQQRYHQMLTDYELQVKNLEISIQSERKTAEQFKLLIQSKNDELRSTNRELEIMERRCQDQENKLLMLSTECDRMKSMLHERDQELDGWKGQFVEREKSHLNELDRYRNENEYNQHLEQQLKEMMHQHRDEVNRLEDLVKMHKSKNSEFQEKGEYANQEIQALHRKLSEITLQHEQSLTDNNRLARDVEAMRQMILERDREIEAFKERILMMERGHQQSLDEMRQHYEFMKKSTIDREMKELGMKHQSERMNLETQTRMQLQRVTELDAKYGVLLSENQRISDQYRQLNEEYELIRQRCSLLEHENLRLNEQQELQKHDHDSNVKQLEQQLRGQVSDLQSELQKARMNFVGEEQKAIQLDQELIRLSAILNQYQMELDQERQHSADLEMSLKDQLGSEVQELRRQVSQDKGLMEEELALKNRQLDQLQEQCNRLAIEGDTVRQQLIRSQGDLENMRLKYSNLDQLRQSEIQDYTQEFESHRAQLKEQLARVNGERQAMEIAFKQQRQKLGEQDSLLLQLQFQCEQQRQDGEEAARVKDNQISKLSQEKHTLEAQNKHLKERLTASESQCQELLEKAARAEQDLIDLQQQSEQDRAQLVQSNLKLEQTNRSLKQTLNQVDLQLQSTRQTLTSSEEALDQAKADLKHQRETSHLAQHQLNEEINSLKLAMDAQSQLVSERSNQNQQQTEEIRKLKAQIKSLESDNRDLQKRLEDLEAEMGEEIEELQLQIEYYQKMQLDQKDWEVKFQAEKTALETQLAQLKTKYDDESKRAEKAVSEYRRLEDVLHEKLKEIDQLRHQLSTTKVSDEEYQGLLKKVAQMQNEVYDLQQDKLRLNNEKSTQEKLVLRLQNDVQQKDQEVQQVYDLMNKRRLEQDGQGRDLDTIRRDNQRLQALVQEHEASLRGRQDQYGELKRENDDLTLQNAQLKRQVASMEDQVGFKHREMTDKIKELDNLKSKYEDQWKQVQSGPSGIQNTSNRLSMIRQSIVAKDFSAIGNPLDDSPETRERKASMGKSYRGSFAAKP